MATYMDWANVSPSRWLNCAFISHHATHRGYDVIDLIAAATSLPTYKSDIYFSLHRSKLQRVRHESIDLWKLYSVVIFYAAFWFNFLFNVKFRFYRATSLTISFTAVLYLSSVLSTTAADQSSVCVTGYITFLCIHRSRMWYMNVAYV